MKIKCEYCGAMIEDTEAECPNCGAANINVKRMTVTTPQTIEQLKSWYVARNLPPYEVTRFFIGENHQGPKAFGIYKDGNEFVVYKNKADGTRAVRYRGTDEAYAVNELYLKLKSEILNQKAHQGSRGYGSDYSGEGLGKSVGTTAQCFLISGVILACFFGKIHFWIAFFAAMTFIIVYNVLSIVVIAGLSVGKKDMRDFEERHPRLAKWLLYNPFQLFKFKRPATLTLLFVIIFAVLVGVFYNTPHYYKYGSKTYVEYHDDWYCSSGYDYTPISTYYLPVEIKNNPADYEYSWWGNGAWNSDVTRFESTSAYKDNYGSDFDWSGDSDYDWDSGSDWDSGGTDWDSDW